jgi:hypothetical protein
MASYLFEVGWVGAAEAAGAEMSTLVNTPPRFFPRAFMVTAQVMQISATKRLYSTAVAPDSSWRKFLILSISGPFQFILFFFFG